MGAAEFVGELIVQAPAFTTPDALTFESIEGWGEVESPATTYEAAESYTPSDLLLHFDGGDGSTSFEDSSLGFYGDGDKTVTTFGGIAQAASAAVFGVSGCIFDGVDDYLSLADSAAWDILASPEFFIEMRLNPDTGNLAGSNAAIFAYHYQDANNRWILYHDNDGNSGSVTFKVISAGSTVCNVVAGAGSLAEGTYQTLAVERYSGTVRLFVDGVIVASAAFAGAQTFTGTFYIGADHTGTSRFKGQMDEFVIRRPYSPANGANYTPAVAAYLD
jgi:hypothetical protein